MANNKGNQSNHWRLLEEDVGTDERRVPTWKKK